MEEIFIRSREDIAKAKRIVIKAGTSIVSTPLGFPSLPRMANIVEHAADLVRAGKEVIIVTSGAIGVGKQKLRHQSKYKNYGSGDESGNLLGPKTYNSAAAAAGQLGLMSLYATMFDQHDITTSQLLVTSFDFASPERCQTLRNVMEQLLHLGIVPLLNENDAVSGNQGYELFGNTFSDNDSLAAIVAGGIQAQLLIILTDVEGVYDRPPSHPQAKVIHTYTKQTEFEVGSKSLQGRGGMGAKVDAAMKAIRGGVPAVVIAAGGNPETISRILAGDEWGTLFLGVNNDLIDAPSPEPTTPVTPSSTAEADPEKINDQFHKKAEKLVRLIAEGIRNGCRALQKVDSATRERILEEIALALENQKAEILAANKLDLEQATIEGLSGQLLKRLKLTEQKIDSLVDGIRCIAKQVEPLGQILSRTEISENLLLEKVSCPIGVLLIIFESRPDCLPQIVACAIRSGNGIVLKGGREAEHSNQILHTIVTEAIERGSDGKVPGSLVGLVTSRAEIPLLLKLDDVIDLVIPRGSASLVRHIKDQTRIPVMGHAEGICHVYVDSEADSLKAVSVVVDAKIDYPAACNSMETLLLHRDTLHNGVAEKVLNALREAGVEILGSDECIQLGLSIRHVEDYSNEYSDLVVSLAIVDNVDSAIAHIHKYGSAHTESIITENIQVAEKFLQEVDSACVFHNASTRFADGYRFGLGAEVGISTGRIGARGPVGVEGLLSFKWKLRSNDPLGHTVGSFSPSANPQRVYNFKSLPATSTESARSHC